LVAVQEKQALCLTQEKQDKKSKMPLLLGIIGSEVEAISLQEVADILKQDLEQSQQFVVTIKTFPEIRTTTEISQFFNEGFPLIVFLTSIDEGKSLAWRIYDATQVVMVRGKKYHKRGLLSAQWAHHIADELWPELLGIKSSFSTQIAYIKRVAKGTQVCTIDPLGKKESVVVPSPLQPQSQGKHVRVAPYWYPDGDNPRLIFSEFTPSNVRLVMTDLDYHTRVVLDVDGTHVGVSYSSTGKDVVFVRSGAIWGHYFDEKTNKNYYRLIIKNQNACVSPNLLSKGDIVYCCRGKIYHYHAETKIQEMIIEKGYCVGPAVYEEKNLLVYSKRIGDTMQLYLYDMKQKTERPLTQDKGDKIDPSWSPCGTWVAFCYEQGASSRIAIMNILTGIRYFLTAENSVCSYPAWSPLLT
jgi:Tol biopolymer transport system component